MPSPSDLTPAETRQRVAALMADGRERTGAEIAARIGATERQVAHALRIMRGMGLLVSERITDDTKCPHGWRRAG